MDISMWYVVRNRSNSKPTFISFEMIFYGDVYVYVFVS